MNAPETTPTPLPAIGSKVLLASWNEVIFTVVSHNHFPAPGIPEMIHVRATIPRGILSTSARRGEFTVLEDAATAPQENPEQEQQAGENEAPAPVPMNKVRAGMGQKAAEYHASKTQCDLHSSPRWHTSRMLRPQDKLAHLLCDLMHHAERDGIDFENTLAVARSLRFTGKRLDDA